MVQVIDSQPASTEPTLPVSPVVLAQLKAKATEFLDDPICQKIIEHNGIIGRMFKPDFGPSKFTVMCTHGMRFVGDTPYEMFTSLPTHDNVAETVVHDVISYFCDQVMAGNFDKLQNRGWTYFGRSSNELQCQIVEVDSMPPYRSVLSMHLGPYTALRINIRNTPGWTPSPNDITKTICG